MRMCEGSGTSVGLLKRLSRSPPFLVCPLFSQFKAAVLSQNPIATTTFPNLLGQ